MRFRSKGQPKGQMLAREQRRITLTIAGIGILVMLMMISGKSSWFTQLFSDPTTAPKKGQPVSEALMGNTELRPDEVEFVPTETPAAANDYADGRGAASERIFDFGLGQVSRDAALGSQRQRPV